MGYRGCEAVASDAVSTITNHNQQTGWHLEGTAEAQPAIGRQRFLGILTSPTSSRASSLCAGHSRPSDRTQNLRFALGSTDGDPPGAHAVRDPTTLIPTWRRRPSHALAAPPAACLGKQLTGYLRNVLPNPSMDCATAAILPSS